MSKIVMLLNDQEALAAQYAYQKWKALQKGGVKRDLQKMMDSSSKLYGKYVAPLAKALNDNGLSIDPGVVMDALFTQARKQKHFDGPFPNSMGSWKYIKTALAAFLELPVEAAMDMMSTEAIMRRFDADYEKACVRLSAARHPHFLSAVPVEFKAAFVKENNRSGLDTLLPELLETMSDNQIARLWIERRLGSYADIAKQYNTK